MRRKPVSTPHVPDEVNVSAIWARMQMGYRCYSQSEFAGAIGVSVGTVRQWEQGRRQPSGPARVLLALLEQDPEIVRDTLKGQG
jgi:putative transcriptional regulator